MENFRFNHTYKNFALLIFDIARVKAHYEKHNLVVGFDVYPETMRVEYEVSKKRQEL